MGLKVNETDAGEMSNEVPRVRDGRTCSNGSKLLPRAYSGGKVFHGCCRQFLELEGESPSLIGRGVPIICIQYFMHLLVCD